jgi:hypothetical protein
MNDSSDPANLLQFIRAAKADGADEGFIVGLLRQNGWSERRIFAAFTAYYKETVGVPVPVRGGRSENARDAFLYLLAFVTLGIWTVAFVWLASALVGHAFPSALDYQNDTGPEFRSTVAGQLASLIVAFPIFLLVSRSIVRETDRRPESLESGVRKWLTYLALVLTSVTLLFDAVWFLQQFLEGDLTLRFVLDVLGVFLVAGGVLWYYLGTVRTAASPPGRDRAFGWAATIAVVTIVILGFTGTGGPWHQRVLSVDERRVTDLRTTATRLSEIYAKNKALPGSLPSGTDVDPTTQKPYTYTPLGGSRFELCATFDEEDITGTDLFWRHPAGPKCYTIDALTF